jgi:hypothetical protein
MTEVKTVLDGVEQIYEFDEAPTQAEIDTAMDTIGGRPKRP